MHKNNCALNCVHYHSWLPSMIGSLKIDRPCLSRRRISLNNLESHQAIGARKMLAPFTFVVIDLIVVLLFISHFKLRPVKPDQYISDRLCQRIGAKVNQSIANNHQQQQLAGSSLSSAVSYSESHHLTYLNFSDGAKYSFWVQCNIDDAHASSSNRSNAAEIGRAHV